ncbi:phage tail tip lysozyme [Lactiplantibacillus plantarum]
MADGAINIDFNIPIEKAESDVQKIKSLFSSVGEGAGDKLDQSFEENTGKVESDAESTHKKVIDIFGKDAEQKIKGDNSDLNEKVSDSKAKLKQLPDEAKTKLIADAKMNGIENFESLLKKLPRSKQTELLAKVSNGEAVDYEELLRKIPSKRVTEVKLNDNASSGLQKLKDEADNTSSRFSRLKDIIIGSFAGQLVFNGINALQDGMKELISSSVEYNKEQQVSLASWTTLTGSASKGQAMVDMANNLSTKFGQARDITDELDQQFYHVLDNAGKTQTLTTSFLTLADTIGLSSDQVKALGQDFTHTLSGGKLQMGDFNQIADYLPMFGENLLKYEQKIQHNSKLTMSQLQKEMSAGKISATDAMNVINQLGDKYKASADNMMNTLPGMERAIKAKAPALVSAFINPFLTAENPLAKSVMKWVNDPSTMSNLKSFGKSFAVIANGATTVIMTAFSGINNILSSFAMSFKANVASVITSSGVKGTVDSFVGSFKDFAKAIEPVELAVGGLVGVIAGGIVRTAVSIISGLAKGFEGVGSGADKAKSKMNFDGVFKIITNISQALNVWYDALDKVFKPLSEIIGTIAKGAFETFGDIISGIAGAFGKLALNSEKGTGPIDLLAKGLSKIAEHQTALKIIGGAIASIVTAVLAVKGVISVVSGLSKAFGIVRGAITAVRGAMTLLMANPLLLIVAAVVAIGVGFYEAYKHIKPFRDAVNALWNDVKKLFTGKLGWEQAIAKEFSSIKKSFSAWIKSFGKGWNSFWSGLGKTLSSWGKNISKAWSSIWSGVKKVASTLWNGLKKAAKVAFEGIKIVALAPIVLLAATLVAIWKLIQKPAKAAWKLIEKYIVNPIVDAYKNVVKWLTSLLNHIVKIWNSISKTTASIWNPIKSFIVNIAEAIWKDVKSFFTNLWKDIQSIWNAISKITSVIWNPIKDFLVKLAKTIWGRIKNAFNNLKDDIDDIWNGIKKITETVWNATGGWVIDKAKDIWKNIKNVFNTLKDDLGGILDKISDKWHDMWNGVSSFFSGIWKDIKGVAKSGINGVIGFLNGGIDGIDKVVHFFGGSKKAISDIPKLAKGSGPVKSGTPAIVNDEQASDFREAILRKDGSVDIPNGRNVLTYLDEGDSVVPAATTKSIFGNIPQYAGGTGDWLGKLWSGTKSFISSATDKAKSIADAIAHPLKTIKGIFSKVTNSAKGVWSTLASSTGGYLANNAVNWFKKTLNGLKDAIDGGEVGNVKLSGSVASRARELARAFKQGYPAAQDGGIAGILGNWIQESNLNPSAVNSSDHGTGLGQWTFTRETGLRRHGYAWNSAAGQIGYALNEPGENGMLKAVLRMTSPTVAAQKFFATWESGGAMDATGGTRLANASAAYRYIKGYANGGSGDQEGYYRLFEGNQKEFVVPNPSVAGVDRSYAVLGQAAAYLGSKGNMQSNNSSDLENAVNKLVSLQTAANDKLEKSINKKVQVVLDTGKMVGAMYSKIDQTGYSANSYQQRNVWE